MDAVPGPSSAERGNLLSYRSLIENPNMQRKERRVHELKEEFRRYPLMSLEKEKGELRGDQRSGEIYLIRKKKKKEKMFCFCFPLCMFCIVNVCVVHVHIRLQEIKRI